MRDTKAIMREDTKRRNARQAEEDALIAQILSKNTSRENLEYATMDRSYMRGIGFVMPPRKAGDPYSRKPRTHTFAGVVDSDGNIVHNAFRDRHGNIVTSKRARSTQPHHRNNTVRGLAASDCAKQAPIGNIE